MKSQKVLTTLLMLPVALLVFAAFTINKANGQTNTNMALNAVNNDVVASVQVAVLRNGAASADCHASVESADSAETLPCNEGAWSIGTIDEMSLQEALESGIPNSDYVILTGVDEIDDRNIATRTQLKMTVARDSGAPAVVLTDVTADSDCYAYLEDDPDINLGCYEWSIVLSDETTVGQIAAQEIPENRYFILTGIEEIDQQRIVGLIQQNIAQSNVDSRRFTGSVSETQSRSGCGSGGRTLYHGASIPATGQSISYKSTYTVTTGCAANNINDQMKSNDTYTNKNWDYTTNNWYGTSGHNIALGSNYGSTRYMGNGQVGGSGTFTYNAYYGGMSNVYASYHYVD